MLGTRQCPEFPVDAYAGSAAGAERLKGLENYGIVVIAAHGDALFGAIGAAYRPEWRWSTTGSQATVLTGTTLSRGTLATWETTCASAAWP
jgi:hypothetical protein